MYLADLRVYSCRVHHTKPMFVIDIKDHYRFLKYGLYLLFDITEQMSIMIDDFAFWQKPQTVKGDSLAQAGILDIVDSRHI